MALASLVAGAVLAAACSQQSTGNGGSASSQSTDAALAQVLSGVTEDGSIDKDTALKAFALVLGPFRELPSRRPTQAWSGREAGRCAGR